MTTLKNSNLRVNKKLVIVGDGMCGKTCLLYAFKDDRFIPDHKPTVFDTYATDIQIDEITVELGLFDTAGQEDYDRLRPLSYPETDVALVCFSVDNPTSAMSVSSRWIPEVRHFCEKCPVILVGCKKDLRTDSQVINELAVTKDKPISFEAGAKLAARMEADAYIECSAKTREGVQDLFIHAARLTLRKPAKNRPHHHRCLVL